jgi:Leucine-rich repeat (LRR) protein
LDLSENGLGQEQLESIISEGTLFEKLYLDGNELKDLSFLADKGNNLEIFSASRCKLTGVSGMGQMVNLYEINLSDNQIESLENFPVLITPSNYVQLDLRNNKLTTLDPLEGCSQVDFSRLYVNGNPLQAEGMNAVSSLDGNRITFDYIEGMDLQILEPFGSKYIAKVPMDQRVVYEDAIYSCFFGTLDEYDQLIED